jgi:hypothetical protein
VGEDGILDAGCFAPLELGRDRSVSDAYGATPSSQRAVERCGITNIQIDTLQGRQRIRQVSHVRHIKDATRSRRYAISDGRRQQRVLHWPGLDDEAGQRELLPRGDDVSHRERPRRHRAPCFGAGVYATRRSSD